MIVFCTLQPCQWLSSNVFDQLYLFYNFQRNYELFNGFVVLHGTDTMAYTASALSFMLEFLGKPVILTGSQVLPLDNV